MERIIICIASKEGADTKQLSSLGKELAWQALERLSGFSKTELEEKGVVLQKEKSGRPVFWGIGAEVSISHTKGLAVAAVSSKRLGIDLECSGRESVKVAKRMFSDYEQQWISEQKQEGKTEAFATVWTLREAYAKWTGLGLAKMPQVEFKITAKDILCSDKKCMAKSFSLHLNQNYLISLVTDSQEGAEIDVFLAEKNFFKKIWKNA